MNKVLKRKVTCVFQEMFYVKVLEYLVRNISKFIKFKSEHCKHLQNRILSLNGRKKISL